MRGTQQGRKTGAQVGARQSFETGPALLGGGDKIENPIDQEGGTKGARAGAHRHGRGQVTTRRVAADRNPIRLAFPAPGVLAHPSRREQAIVITGGEWMLRGKAVIKIDGQVARFRETLRQPPMGGGTARDPCAAVEKKHHRVRSRPLRNSHVGMQSVAQPHLLMVIADARGAGHERFVALREGLDLRPNPLDTCRRACHERFEIAQKLLFLTGHGVLLRLSPVRGSAERFLKITQDRFDVLPDLRLEDQGTARRLASSPVKLRERVGERVLAGQLKSPRIKILLLHQCVRVSGSGAETHTV